LMSRQIARELRKRQTDAERILWPYLEILNVPHTHFRRQAAIGPYVADFVCHAARLIVELDGDQHGANENMARDFDRTVFLESRGYKVLRFWNADVFKNKDAVVETIFAELAQRNPPPGAASRADLPARGR